MQTKHGLGELFGQMGQEDATVGPAFDPEVMLAARRSGATVEDLIHRSWALRSDLPDPMLALTGAV
ncbi:hypothetical protein ABZS61_18555 [Streptomyces sp. NPDC005566]|uniref:hypothetical protein n=1 Tax=Streptomyces sp. NPDC005566 TaxID=3156886 RepID=UPI0033B01874